MNGKDRLAFSIDEVAQQIGKTPKAVRNLIARNLMPHRKIGRSIVIPRADLERFLTELPGLSTEDALARVEERTGDRTPLEGRAAND